MANAYYSGSLAAINQGQTADAVAQNQYLANFQNYLAQLNQDRTRQQIASQDVGVRRELGLGALANQTADLGLRRDLGFGALDQNQRIAEMQNATQLEQIQAQMDQLKQLGVQQMELWKAGGGRDPRLAMEINRTAEEHRQLAARAQALATEGNAAYPAAVEASRNLWNKLPFTDTTNPIKVDAVPGTIMAGFGPDAGLVQWDPATKTFSPARSLFPEYWAQQDAQRERAAQIAEATRLAAEQAKPGLPSTSRGLLLQGTTPTATPTTVPMGVPASPYIPWPFPGSPSLRNPFDGQGDAVPAAGFIGGAPLVRPAPVGTEPADTTKAAQWQRYLSTLSRRP